MARSLFFFVLGAALVYQAASDCDRNWVENGDDCLFLGTDPLDFESAFSACQDLNAELTSILSRSENSFILSMMNDGGVSNSWIGFTEMNLETFIWIDGSTISYTNWAKNEPDERNAREQCAYMQSDGLWYDDSCDSSYPYICKEIGRRDDPATLPPIIVGICPDGYYSEVWSNKCFKVGEGTTKTFQSAQDACESDGAVLASITSAAEQSLVLLLIEDLNDDVWIGLQDLGQYEWLDGSQLDYSNYAPLTSRTQDEECFAIDRTGDYLGQWIKKNCDTMAEYLCQAERVESTTETDDPVFANQYQDSSCVDGFVYHDRCFKFVEDALSFDNAHAACMGDGAELAMTVDLFEVARLHYESMKTLLESKASWIGVEYQRASGKYVFGDGSYSVTNVFWDATQPDGQIADTCVDVFEGFWFDDDCDTAFPYFCEYGDQSALVPTVSTATTSKYCPSSDMEEYGDYCYWASVGTSYTWDDASDGCQAMGMELVSIHDPDENAFVDDLSLYNRGDDTTWIGLELSEYGSFRWIDGTDYNYALWDVNNPLDDENAKNLCGLMYTDGPWIDVGCSTEAGYVCKTNKVCCCPIGWSGYQSYCYSYENLNMDWYSAFDYCQTNGAELVSILTPEENDFILNLVQYDSSVTQNIWIGYSEINLDHYSWVDGSLTSFENFANNEPDDDYGAEMCVSMKIPDGTWIDENCALTHKFVCKMTDGSTEEPATQAPAIDGICPAGYLSEDYSNKCFKVESTSSSWEDASLACQDQSGVLASIASAEEQSFVLLLIEDYTSDAWLGLHVVKNQYVWVDNSPLTYTNYAPTDRSTQNEECYAMDRTTQNVGMWKKKNCDEETIYICEALREASTEEDPDPFADQYSDATCLSDWFYYHGRCYKYYEGFSTWDEANVTCVQDSAQLALPADTFEVARLTYESYKLNGRSQETWTAVYYKQETGSYVWSDNAYTVETTFWADREPSMDFEEACISMRNGLWYDQDCSMLLPFFCMSGDTSDLIPTTVDPSGLYCENSDHFEYRDYCYSTSTIDVAVTWSEANAACQEAGMELVSIHSTGENDFVDELTEAIRGDDKDTWIGLDGGTTGDFRWTDGTNFNYDNWARGKAGEDECVVMQSSGTWTGVACSNLIGYTCKTDMVTRTTTPGTTVTTTTTTATTTATTTEAQVAVVTPAPAAAVTTQSRDDDIVPDSDSVSDAVSSGMSTAAVAAIVICVLIVVAVLAVAGFLKATGRWSLVRSRLPFRSTSFGDRMGLTNQLYDKENETLHSA